MLVDAVGEALGREFLDLVVEADPGDGKLLAYLEAKGEVLSRTYEENAVHFHVRMAAGAMGPVQKAARTIRPAGMDPIVELTSTQTVDSSPEVA